MKTDQEWAYSNYEDGEQWTPAGSREDCIEEGRHEASGDHFFIRPVKYPTAKDVVTVDVDSILEYIVESCDFIPEPCFETWLANVSNDAKNELEVELSDVIVRWMTRQKLEPNWFEIGKVEYIEVEADDES